MRIVSYPVIVRMRTIKFKSLSSGSCGNCYFIGIFRKENGNCEGAVLIDAGVSPRRLSRELLKDGIPSSAIKAILITHDHCDHIRSLGSFCKHLKIPVWTTPVLSDALSRHFLCRDFFSSCKNVLSEGITEIPGLPVKVRYFLVPHDATQTVGYALDIEGFHFAIMTDIGKITEEALSVALKADTLVIESNYDAEMLQNGPYPEELQNRIRGGNGHLSNAECAKTLEKLSVSDRLHNVFLCHLSEHNNTPSLALKCASSALDTSVVRLVALPRQTPTQLFTLQLGDNC